MVNIAPTLIVPDCPVHKESQSRRQERWREREGGGEEGERDGKGARGRETGRQREGTGKQGKRERGGGGCGQIGSSHRQREDWAQAGGPVHHSIPTFTC